MKNEEKTIENLIAGGIIGAALGALLTAHEKALKTNLPVLVKECNAIYEVRSNGSKKLVKKLPAKAKNIPSKITLK